jgi:hypothetical protein
MSWFRTISAMSIIALAFSSVAAQSTQTGGQGKGKGNQGGGGLGNQGSGGQSKGGGGGLGNQGSGGQSKGQGGGVGNKGQGNQGGGGLGNQGGGQTKGNQGGGGLGNKGQGSGGSGGGLGNQGSGGQSKGNQGGGLGNKGQGNSGGGFRSQGSGLGNKGQGTSGGGFGQSGSTTNRSQGSLGKGTDRGRLGGTSYGSSNNRGDRFDIGQAPTTILQKGSIMSQVLRSEQVRVNTRFRDGYSSYYRDWRDDYFYYPHYSFSPYGNNCSFSPWYYYPHLPGYVSLTRIFYIGNTSWNWNNGNNYNWNRNYRGSSWDSGWGNNRDSNYVDEAIGDLVNAFERRDRRALGRLIPRRGRINIYMDDTYTYSLEADDFYDLMLDNIETTRTTRYEIERVRTWRDEVQVTARHEYTDPWGRRSSVYHNYRLEEDRNGFIITDFRTSWRR